MSSEHFTVPGNAQLGAVSLRVRDLAVVVGFYTELLGLEQLSHDNAEVVLGYDQDRVLVRIQDHARGEPRPRSSNGLYHLALLVPGREDLAHALLRLGKSQYPLQGYADHFVSEAIYLADPEGNGIEIYADRPRDHWEWIDGQLSMGTAPLNIESLMALVDRRREDEAVLSPATIMGHIHLRVTDLEQAQAFYGEVLGFDLMATYGPSAAFFAAGGYHHHIGMNTWESGFGMRAGKDMLGLARFEIHYPDQRTVDRLSRHLEQRHIAHQALGEGVLLEDPSGNELWIRPKPG